MTMKNKEKEKARRSVSETEGGRWIKGSERAIERRMMHGFMGRDGTDSKACRSLFIKIT